MTTPKPAKLIRQIPLSQHGGILRVADLDGDGECELLLLQAGGQTGTAASGTGSDLIDQEDRELHCLTAMKLDGTVLWQRGTPWSRPSEPFVAHGSGGMFLADDIDNDGRIEVLCIRKDELLLLEGAIGELRRSVRLPADNFLRIFTLQLSDPKDGKQILCKVNDGSYPPWGYANPNVIYNADLSLRSEPFAVRGAGHNVVALDLDGDGRHDAIFNGFSCFNNDLTERWCLDFGPDYDYDTEHADHIHVADVNGDGHLEVCYAGSKDFIVTDLNGKTLWTAEAGHSQTSTSGSWGPNGEPRIILSEKNLGLRGFDGKGNPLWRRTDINGYAHDGIRWGGDEAGTHWAFFRPQIRPSSQLPWTSDPVTSRSLWPQLIDGQGVLHEAFPWDEAYAHPPRVIRSHRSYDCGLWYDIMAGDVDGDGRDEVIIYNRDNVFLFKCG